MTTEQSPLSEAELLPCPFCGERAINCRRADPHDDHRHEYYVKCLGCKAESTFFIYHRDDAHAGKVRAIVAWNTRAEVRRSRTGGAEPFCYVREWPAHFDPQTGGEPASTDFSDVPKPGYEPLYRHPPLPEDGGAGGVVEPTEAMLEAGEEARKQHTDRYLDGSEVAHGDVVEHIWRAMVSASLPAPIAAAEPAGTPVVTEGMVEAALAAQPHNSPVSYFLNPNHNLSEVGVRELMRSALEAALAFSEGAQNG